MKRRKHKPLKGSTIILVEFKLVSKRDDEVMEDIAIYYFDKKRRRMFKEDYVDLTSLKKLPEDQREYIYFVDRRSQRSINALIERYYYDFKKVDFMFKDFDMNLTEVGEL